ncbi:MAG TPA: hypothetical protein VGN12_23290 [Pirellulales bacterium]
MSRKAVWLAAALALWGLCGVIAWGALMLFQQTPGISAQAPSQWPASTNIRPSPGRAQLVVFVHPRCPCTRATLDELKELVENATTPVDVHLLYYRPAGTEKDWLRTDLWDSASRISNAVVHEDINGELARRFGVKTSGQVLYYDGRGRLLLATGITAGRGNTGANQGRDAVAALLAGHVPSTDQAAVFGCPLGNDTLFTSRLGSVP